ncbi:MAG TPA: DUF1674 domain-containing protein [Xanthomonadaceae bacterium]|nr:DUF1674 domain-containing protein [Xanthomonadaceae bacterium]
MKTTIIGQIPEPATPPEAQAPLPGATPVANGGVVADTEVGGRGGLDPVRYGDWEKNGRCIDF